MLKKILQKVFYKEINNLKRDIKKELYKKYFGESIHVDFKYLLTNDDKLKADVEDFCFSLYNNNSYKVFFGSLKQEIFNEFVIPEDINALNDVERFKYARAQIAGILQVEEYIRYNIIERDKRFKK